MGMVIGFRPRSRITDVAGPLGFHNHEQGTFAGMPVQSGSRMAGPMGTLHPSMGTLHTSTRAGGWHAPAGRPVDIVLRRGDRGVPVEKLQALLNLRLHPHPRLKIDGYFGPKTVRSLGAFQILHSIRENGVAGRQTWRALVFEPSDQSPTDEMMAWPAGKKILEAARRISGRLPLEASHQLQGRMSFDGFGPPLAELAAARLFGAGELIGLSILLSMGELVACEIAHGMHIAALASTSRELDEAAGHWARALEIGGPAAVWFALARMPRDIDGGGPSADQAGPARPESAPKLQVRSLPKEEDPGAPAPPVEEPDTFAASHDAEAQASGLQNAAATGAPFCEECQRLARSHAIRPTVADSAADVAPRSRVVPLPPVDADTYGASHDAQAQADNLRTAAAQGVPFCEECQKLKKEAA